MITWVLYDIQDDKSRNKVSRVCKKAGLHRVQYSCFLGMLDKEQLDILELEIYPEINHEIDKVYIFPMNRQEMQMTILLGQAFDKKMITDELKALFF